MIKSKNTLKTQKKKTVMPEKPLEEVSVRHEYLDDETVWKKLSKKKKVSKKMLSTDKSKHTQ